MRALEEEASRLKRLMADQALQIHILKEVNAKSGGPVHPAGVAKLVVAACAGTGPGPVTTGDWLIRVVDVITVVEAAMTHYEMPSHLRSDNGPEFIL